MKVLVTVASRHGSTADIGAVVADVLEEAGMRVDRVRPDDVIDVAGYDAVVLGSAIYAGRWVHEATAFVDRLAPQLTERPVWVFSSGPLGDPPQPAGIPPAAEQVAARVAPVDHRVFAGALDRDDLNLAERAIVKMVKAPYGDFRNWMAVRAWARSIAHALRERGTAPASGIGTAAP